MFAALAPDLDGVFMLVTWFAMAVKKILPPLAQNKDGIIAKILAHKDFFYGLHHTFGHNLFYVVLISALVAALARSNRVRMFMIGALMILLHYIVDFITAPIYPIPFFWPLSKVQYDLPTLLAGPLADLDKWHFWLAVVLQNILKVCFIAGTVFIYIKHRRTFLEFISVKFDRFLLNFAVLPFKKKCDVPDCNNRAHYHCDNCDSDRCIRHCTINRDLTITCDDCKAESLN